MNEPRFEVFPQHEAMAPEEEGPGEPTGEYGWRFRAANGQITATSGEGFTRREDAHRAVSDFIRAVIDDPHDFPSAYKPFPPILDVDE